MLKRDMMRTVAALALVVGLLAWPAPAASAVTGEGHAWPAFNESAGCGQPQGFAPPFVSKTGFLSASESIGGPSGSFFGRTVGQVQQKLVWWTVPMSNGKRVQVHEYALPAFQRVAANLAGEAALGRNYEVRSWDTWGFAARTVGGSYRMSRHALGIAVDINAGSNPYRSDNTLVTNMPTWFVNAWRDAGFCWGGDWVDSKDPMHFSWMGPGSTTGATSIPNPVAPLTAAAGFTSTAAVAEPQFAPLLNEWDYHFADGNRDGALDLFRLRPWLTNTAVEFVRSSMDYQICGMGDNIAAVQHRGDNGVLLADLDGTSRPDLWTLDTSGSVLEMTVYSHASDYTTAVEHFATGVAPDSGDYYALADFDRDGLLDLYIMLRNAPNTIVQVWSGASRFTKLIVHTATDLGSTGDEERWHFAIGDRDVDGIPDLYAVETAGTVTVHVLAGSARYQTIDERLPTGLAAAGLRDIALSDFDGDGRDDLYVLNDDGSIRVMSGNVAVAGQEPTSWFEPADWSCSDRPASNGSLTAWTDFYTNDGWTSQLVGDFNGDGKDDIANYHPSTGRWYIAKSTGTSFTIELWADFYTNDGWTSQIVGDFNGDGRDDIANFHPSTGRWYIARSTGTSFRVSRWSDFVTNDGWTSQLVGDFNGDGRDDIANFHPSTGRWYIGRSTGTSFSTRQWSDFVTNDGWTSQLVGDFNGDGRDDIANFHPSTGRWYIGRSTGTSFSTRQWSDFTTNDGWANQLAADFNGDGKDDIANFYPANGRWFISRSTGFSFVAELWEQYATGGSWNEAAAGPFNVDSSIDLAAFRASSATWDIGISTGDRFHTSTWFTGPTSATWGTAAVGDFNGDGALDVASFDRGTGRWYTGLAAGP